MEKPLRRLAERIIERMERRWHGTGDERGRRGRVEYGGNRSTGKEAEKEKDGWRRQYTEQGLEKLRRQDEKKARGAGKSVERRRVPDAWRRAIIVSLYKKGKHNSQLQRYILVKYGV
ncbi:hypothetical protein QLX08_002907 [Tetragonisca angustula]|uniref:Uncharacterized protein n=1 Tax=Tetragonisca angustula TaxID=166442 RepID=A0AAW1AC05_9HYME